MTLKLITIPLQSFVFDHGYIHHVDTDWSGTSSICYHMDLTTRFISWRMSFHLPTFVASEGLLNRWNRCRIFSKSLPSLLYQNLNLLNIDGVYLVVTTGMWAIRQNSLTTRSRCLWIGPIIARSTRRMNFHPKEPPIQNQGRMEPRSKIHRFCWR